jgi:hypothetical protein
MAHPLPLPVWDRQRKKLVQEWMDDGQPTYETHPRRSIAQWLKSHPLYDWLGGALAQLALSVACHRGNIDITAPEQIVEASNTVPTVPIGLDHKPMLSCFVRMAVILR